MEEMERDIDRSFRIELNRIVQHHVDLFIMAEFDPKYAGLRMARLLFDFGSVNLLMLSAEVPGGVDMVREMLKKRIDTINVEEVRQVWDR
jgi:hypothetical protein